MDMNSHRWKILLICVPALVMGLLCLSGPRESGGVSIHQLQPPLFMASGSPDDATAIQLEIADSPESSHPVERAVATGAVLDARIMPAAEKNHWTRVRLVQTKVQPRPVRVVELWRVIDAEQPAICLKREMFLADQLIVKPSLVTDRRAFETGLASAGMWIDNEIQHRLFTVRLPNADLDAVPEALVFLSAHPELAEYAEPDGVGFGAGTPNDASFANQWGNHNTGQSGGTADADVDAPEFWDIIESTPGIVVAVLDSGLNFTHPDLSGIGWTNPNEIAGDGIDNDASGKVDDIKGWDFVNNDNDPIDDHGHGSNVSGIIAANRNNNQGIAGMLSGVRILACKILNSGNSGSTSNLISAVTYARQRGVPVMNLSLQNYPFNSSLNTEFNACQTAGILLSICAGNQGVNNDTTPNYPSSYTQSNIIAVGNHDRTDVRWSSSNYGPTSVDLFAPGREILSPVLGTGYSYYTGTSQATPYVTAVCAAIKYANPSWSAGEIKNSVLSSVVARPSYGGVCVTGGRLNAVNSISHAFRQIPTQDSDGDRFSNLFEYIAGTRMDTASSKPSVVSNITGGFLRIGVSRVSRDDAHFEVQTSADLSNWTTIGVTDFSTPNVLTRGIPVSASQRGFVRIAAIPSP